MNHLKLKTWRLEVWTEMIRVDKIVMRKERLIQSQPAAA